MDDWETDPLGKFCDEMELADWDYDRLYYE